MFNLEKEVEMWCRSVQSTGCEQQERIEELQDHLYCEIELLQEQGFDEEQAFLKATERLGKVDVLGAEYAKNRSLLATLCAIEGAHSEVSSGERLSWRKTAVIPIVHSLLFAAAMLIAPLLVNDPDEASLIVFGVLIPLWFATYAFLPGTQNSARREWQFLKRLFGSAR